ncbi:MAG: TolC family protein, partial [Burkholderiaceae bacterium]
MKIKQTPGASYPIWGRCHITLLMSVLIALPLTVDAQFPLTLERAQSLASQKSAQLVAHDAAGKAAREMAVAAGQLPDPILKLGINNLPINGEDRLSLSKDFMTMRSVGVMQEFTREAKRSARASRFDKEAETVSANRTLTLANLQRATALAWFDRYYQERIVELLQRQRSEIKLQIDASEAVYRGGRGSLSDVYAARSSLVQMDDRIAQSERLVATAIVQLTRWIGDAAAHPLGSPPEMTRVNIGDDNLEAQLQHHPQITVMAAQENTALADAELARASKQADWTVELMVNKRGAAYSNMVSINASVPLQWNPTNRQDREL